MLKVCPKSTPSDYQICRLVGQGVINAQVVFVTDIYSPNPNTESVGAGGQAVAETIKTLGLDVSLIVGGHGGAISMEDFTGLLGQ